MKFWYRYLSKTASLLSMSGIAHQAAPSFNRLRTKATLLRSVGISTGLSTMNNSHWVVKVRNWSCAPLNFSSRLPGDQSNSGCGATCGATPSWGKLCPRCYARCIMALCRFVISVSTVAHVDAAIMPQPVVVQRSCFKDLLSYSRSLRQVLMPLYWKTRLLAMLWGRQNKKRGAASVSEMLYCARIQ